MPTFLLMSATPPAASLAPYAADAPLEAVLAGCRAYEPAAQWALYARFAGPMLLVAQRYAPTAADAEDALQEAFIKVFGQLQTQREPAAFAGWVRRIVVRTALNAGRARRVRRIEFDLDDAHHVPAPDASALDQLTLAEVQALIERLPEGCRVVLLLYTVDGFSHQEIGELLGVGTSASKAQLTRARQRLTRLLAAESREARPAPPGSAATAPAPLGLPPFHPLTTLLFQ